MSRGRCATSQNVSARHVSQELNHSQYQCSLDDILHVAGQELEKIRSNEELVAAQKISNARKKLSFSRCHSDSCIQPTVAEQSTVSEKQNLNPTAFFENVKVSEDTPLASQKNVCITLTDSKSKSFTITRKLVEVPVNAMPRKVMKESPLNLCNITPKQAQTLSTLFGLPTQHKQAGGIKQDCQTVLTSAKADFMNNNKPIVQTIPNILLSSLNRVNNASSNQSTLSSPVVPGKYRAIKVGNVVRLVPFIPATVVNSAVPK